VALDLHIVLLMRPSCLFRGGRRWVGLLEIIRLLLVIWRCVRMIKGLKARGRFIGCFRYVLPILT
jgi:hypothetical protein